MPRLEEFKFYQQRSQRNTSDWLDLQKTDNIKAKNKTKKILLEDLETMKAKVPELKLKGLNIPLTVTTVDMGTRGMYLKLAPYGLKKLKEECIRAARK